MLTWQAKFSRDKTPHNQALDIRLSKGNTMKRVTIYVDDKVWEGIKAYTLELSVEAREKVSAGSYLTGLHLKYGGKAVEKGYEANKKD